MGRTFSLNFGVRSARPVRVAAALLLFSASVAVPGVRSATAQSNPEGIITAPKNPDLGAQIRELTGESDSKQPTQKVVPRKDCGKDEKETKTSCSKLGGAWNGVKQPGSSSPECCCDCPSGNPCETVQPTC